MARRRRGRGVGTLLVILGVVAVLGGTFAAGFLSGRHWERVRVVTGLVKPQAGKEPTRERAGATKPAEPSPPALTFYQELTAPLAAPPPRAKSEAPRPMKTEPLLRVDAAPKPEPMRKVDAAPKPGPAPRVDAVPKVDAPPKVDAAPKPEPAPPAPPVTQVDGARGFTVQMAAYATRAQAQALAERLDARGFPADVSETTTPGGVRYRVRVGTHATKDAARDTAARLAAEVKLSGFVTVR